MGYVVNDESLARAAILRSWRAGAEEFRLLSDLVDIYKSKIEESSENYHLKTS